MLGRKIKGQFNLKELKKFMFSKRARLWLGLIAALSLLSLASSCGGNKTATDDNGGGGSTNGKNVGGTNPVQPGTPGGRLRVTHGANPTTLDTGLPPAEEKK